MKKSDYKKVKQFMCFDCQCKILEERGMTLEKPKALDLLQDTNYYRLSGYWYHFQNKDTDEFIEDISIELIEKLYQFDSDLRRIISQLLEGTEIKLRTALAYIHAKNHGPIGYRRSQNFRKGYNHYYFTNDLIPARIDASENREFVRHHLQKYGEKFIPIWVLVEILTYENIAILHQNMLSVDREEIKKFLIPINPDILQEWNFALIDLRNECAHHNRIMLKPRYSIKIHDKYSDMNIVSTSLFAYVLAAKHILNSGTRWSIFISDLKYLLEKYSMNPKAINFPENWVEIAGL